MNPSSSLLLALAFLSTAAPAQEIFHGCGRAGDATSSLVQELNRLKNRYQPPDTAAFDSSVNLARVVKPGNDENRWNDSSGAELVGFVYAVKEGGVETCNCHATAPDGRDTHIELVLHPLETQGKKRVIVEVTPRVRAAMNAHGVDWSTRALKKLLVGHWVRVRGWMLYDIEHADESENTNPGARGNWRATAWEIHPVMSIELLSHP